MQNTDEVFSFGKNSPSFSPTIKHSTFLKAKRD